MKNKKFQLIGLFAALLLFAGLGCKQTSNTNSNSTAAANQNAAPTNTELPKTNSTNSGTATNQPPTNTNQVVVAKTDLEARAKSDIEKIARFFTEYFGSYSTDSNFTNVTGLKIYMTQSMQKWADGFVADAKKSQQNQKNITGYFGVTTKSVSLKTAAFSDQKGTAEVVVSTQRREATGTSTNARIYYQDMIVSFAKEKNVWKVNEAKWK